MSEEPVRAHKAVIPVAGLGIEFLPATKVVQRELLPVVDRPILQFVVEEAADAGLYDLLLVVAPGKSDVISHFDRDPDLESYLEAKGESRRLNAVRRLSELAEIFTITQGQALGLGHAVAHAETFVGDNPFALLLGDEFFDPDDPLLPAMLDLQELTGGAVIALCEVDVRESQRYGIASVEPAGPALQEPVESAGLNGLICRITELVEKPDPAVASSDLAIAGRYILPPQIFSAIRETKPGAGGEIQLTDALVRLLHDGIPVHGLVYRGKRHDTGTRLGYLKAVVDHAIRDGELGDDFRPWLAETLQALSGQVSWDLPDESRASRAVRPYRVKAWARAGGQLVVDVAAPAVLGTRTFDRAAVAQAIRLDAYLDTDDLSAAEQIFDALDQIAVLIGYRQAEDIELRRGSVFRRAKARIASWVSSEEVAQRQLQLERAFELQYIDNRQAEVDLKLGQAVAQLIASLHEVPQACMRVSSILLVKYDDGKGPVLVVRSLSQIEMRALDKFPEIQMKPRQALAALASAVVEME
ncbi:MAG: UTP--glucose-1-phosphate uridylyltransferase [Hamadaea sp.]|nr:UTP--glucose-1-phosphate uridylyltransferase [Hamadaea sp.]